MKRATMARRIVLPGAALLCGLVLVGCESNDTQPPTGSQTTMNNSSRDSGPSAATSSDKEPAARGNGAFLQPVP